MTKILSILPGIILAAYFTLGNMAAFRIPLMRPFSLIGFILMAVTLFLRKRVSGISALDRGFFTFMALNAAAFWGLPQTLIRTLTEFSAGILYLILLAAVALPALFAGKYFTEYFARKQAPEAVWETDIFKTINRHMTWVWAAIFAVSGLVTVIPHLLSIPGSPLTGLVFYVLIPALIMTGIGIPFNRIYPAYYQRKLGMEPLRKVETVPSVTREKELMRDD